MGRAREADRISGLPDGVVGDIVSFLPTKDGARTQILSSRWRHIWRSAPLNLDLHDDDDAVGRSGVRPSKISRILSAHPGPCRRFVVTAPFRYTNHANSASTTTLDGWLRSPALDSLQELGLNNCPLVLLPPPSVGRFSSTLRVASFGYCAFPAGNNGGAPLLLPALESLTLSESTISESSLLALLAGCPVLQSLALFEIYGPRLQVVSPSLRNITLGSYRRTLELVIYDAPCLERLQCSRKTHMNISVISAPRLAILGELFDGDTPWLQFGTTVLQGSTVVSMAAAVHSVRALSLSGVKLCLDAAINLLKCFPQLEKFLIKATSICVENAWYQTNPERIGTLNIGLRKIVLVNYQESQSHVDFVNFFLSNVRALESLELRVIRNIIITNEWIAKQHSLLSIKSSSSGARVDFVPHKKT